MLIRGTRKLNKKTLDLQSIRQQIKNGQTLPIHDDHLRNTDIQIAINMGLLEIFSDTPVSEGSGKPIVPRDPNRKIRCQNMLDRPLALPFRRDEEGKPLFQKEIRANEVFTIVEKHINVPEVQAAISAGLIKILENEEKKNKEKIDCSETTIRLKDLIKGDNVTKCQEKLVEAAKQKQKLDTNEEIGALSKEVDEGVVWNPGTKKAVKSEGKPTLADRAIRTSDVSESKPAAAEVIKGVIPTRYVDSEEPIRVNPNVDDPRVNPATVMNPTGKPVTTKTGVYDPTVMESSKPDDAPKVTPLSKEEAAMIKNEQDDFDILFVDKEQEKARRAQHPVLGKEPPLEQNKEIDFV